MTTDLTTTKPAPMILAGQAANYHAARHTFEDYQSRKAENTLRSQRASLKRFAAYLAAVGVDVDAGELDSDPAAWQGVTFGLVKGFVLWLVQQGDSVGTIGRRLSHVKTYAGLAHQAGYIDDGEALKIASTKAYGFSEGKNLDAMRPVTRRGAKKAEATPVTSKQAKQLKRQPDTPQGRRDAVLVCLLVDHGLRASELAGLQVTDFDFEAGQVIFYRPKVKKVQTHRLTADTLRALRRYFDAGDAPAMGALLRASTTTGGTQLTHAGMSTRAINARVRQLGEKIGLPGLSPHDLRHLWASTAARAGTPVDRLQQAGGWTSPAMPLRYIAEAEIANEGVKLDE